MKRWGKRLWACALIFCILPWTFPAHGQPEAQMPEPGEPEETVFTLLESGGEDRPITRAEAAAVVVRAFGATEEAGMQEYVDVPENSWYRQDMARAVAMEVMQGYEGYLRPQETLTYEEAALIFKRLLCLNRMPEGEKAEHEPITRGEFVQMGARLVPQRLTAGSQGWQLEGTTLITQSGDYSKLMVMGDLILTEKASGQICLEDVVVYGRLIVRGSGQVTMKGVSWADQVLLSGVADSVHLEAEKGCVTKLKVSTPMATLSGVFTQVDLESDSVRLVLNSARVENVRMLADHNVVMASPGSFVRYLESWGAQGAVMGTGQVEQVRAHGNALYVETPGTQVIALPGSNDVWAGGVLLGGGSLVTPGEGQGPSDRPGEPEEPEEPGGGDSGSSEGGSGTPPDETEEWPMDQVILESDHTSRPISGVTAEEEEGIRRLKLEMGSEEQLAWGYPSQETRETFENRDPNTLFGMVGLNFQPGGELKEGGTTTVSWNSKTLMAMGFTQEDSGDDVAYEQENQGLTRRWTVDNSELEQGLRVFVPISALEEQIPVTIRWNEEEEVTYQLCVGTLEFQWMTPPELTVESTSRGPEITLSYHRGGPVESSVLRLVSAQDPQQEYGRWESSHLEAGEVSFQWMLTGENCPPFGEKLLLTLEETYGADRKTWEKELSFTGEEMGELLPKEEGILASAAQNDNLTAEQTQVLKGMWDEEGETPFAGLLSFEGQTLKVDISKAQGLGDWCQENLGRRELPVAVYSTAPLPGIDTGLEWITPVLWVDADELAQEGLDCVAAEEGLALFILRYGNTIEEGTN